MSRRIHHRLPDGTSTTSYRKYVKTWRAVADSVTAMFGWERYAYDPDFTFQWGGHIVTMPTVVALRLVAMQAEIDKLRARTPVRCPTCMGRRIVYDTDNRMLLIDCPTCGGSGATWAEQEDR